MTTLLPRIATAMNESRDPRVLGSLAMEGVSLAVWQRDLAPGLAEALDALPAERLPRMRRALTVGEVAPAVRAACIVAGTGEAALALSADVARLAGLAAEVLTAPLLQIRLDVTEGQPCPKWHLDAVPARMICALRGPGTEYGPIGPGGDPQAVHRLARGAVGMFRGALWPGPELAAIVHRSPPADGDGPRLLLVIDPVADTEA